MYENRSNHNVGTGTAATEFAIIQLGELQHVTGGKGKINLKPLVKPLITAGEDVAKFVAKHGKEVGHAVDSAKHTVGTAIKTTGNFLKSHWAEAISAGSDLSNMWSNFTSGGNNDQNGSGGSF